MLILSPIVLSLSHFWCFCCCRCCLNNMDSPMYAFVCLCNMYWCMMKPAARITDNTFFLHTPKSLCFCDWNSCFYLCLSTLHTPAMWFFCVRVCTLNIILVSNSCEQNVLPLIFCQMSLPHLPLSTCKCIQTHNYHWKAVMALNSAICIDCTYSATNEKKERRRKKWCQWHLFFTRETPLAYFHIFV